MPPRRDVAIAGGFAAAILALAAVWLYAKATPSFRAGPLLGVATLGVVVVAGLWAVGRTRRAFATGPRAVGLLAFVAAGGYLVYDLWWMRSMYQVWWWDHVTHTVSAALLASVGYTVARAREFQGGTSGGVGAPSRWVFIATAGVVVCGVVAWETYELLSPVVTVYGLEDTVKDVFFDGVGLAVVLLRGPRYLDGVARDVARRWGGAEG